MSEGVAPALSSAVATAGATVPRLRWATTTFSVATASRPPKMAWSLPDPPYAPEAVSDTGEPIVADARSGRSNWIDVGVTGCIGPFDTDASS